ncbi:hemicentin-2-like [Carassius gibelio]|uniref:hemicentin-2-like n=1 Tax=Carassius gibelio TaxID=101364 RepID=UPI002278F173|nr:hemicentin-2-like [Carassius gibelio]
MGPGVFGETVSVLEGDSVTLNTDLTEILEDDDILWKFGAEMSLIAEISREKQIFYKYDNVPDGIFRDRLKLDNQTGSLTIMNITTQHAGLYELQISGAKLTSKTFSVSVYAHLPVPNITRDCSSSSSSSASSYCSLLCSVVNLSHVTLSWYKGNSLLSSISVSDLSISLSLPLEVEYQEKNSYSCVINNPISNQTTHLDISQLCHTCSGVFEVSLIKGDSVTLSTDVTEIPENNDILWTFGVGSSLIAEIRREKQIFSMYDVPDGIFRDRLKLDYQTGSLTITNITTQHTGVYELQISGAKLASKTFSVSVYGRLSVPNITRDCSSSSSSSCSLVCSVVNVGHVTLTWYKRNSLLSSISVSDLSISLSLPLEVEYQDRNSYSCVINNPISHQTRNLEISKLCQPCADSDSLTVLISVAVAEFLLIFAGFGIFCICWKCRKADEEGKCLLFI